MKAANSRSKLNIATLWPALFLLALVAQFAVFAWLIRLIGSLAVGASTISLAILFGALLHVLDAENRATHGNWEMFSRNVPVKNERRRCPVLEAFSSQQPVAAPVTAG